MYKCIDTYIRTPLPFNTLKWGLLRLAPTIYFFSTCGVMFFLFLTIFEANQTPTGKTIFTYVMILACNFVFVCFCYLNNYLSCLFTGGTWRQDRCGGRLSVLHHHHQALKPALQLYMGAVWGSQLPVDMEDKRDIWSSAVQGGTARDLKCCIPILTAKHIPNIVEFLIVTTFQYCIPRLYEVHNICSSTSQSDGKGACRASDPEPGGDVHHSCTHKLFC